MIFISGNRSGKQYYLEMVQFAEAVLVEMSNFSHDDKTKTNNIFELIQKYPKTKYVFDQLTGNFS